MWKERLNFRKSKKKKKKKKDEEIGTTKREKAKYVIRKEKNKQMIATIKFVKRMEKCLFESQKWFERVKKATICKIKIKMATMKKRKAARCELNKDKVKKKQMSVERRLKNGNK